MKVLVRRASDWECSELMIINFNTFDDVINFFEEKRTAFVFDKNYNYQLTVDKIEQCYGWIDHDFAKEISEIKYEILLYDNDYIE